MVETAKIPKCHGNTLYQIKYHLKKIYGEEKLKEMIDKCSPETKKVVEGTVISTQWYPESVVAEWAKACYEVIGEAESNKTIRTIAQDEIKAVFKMFLKLFVNPIKFAENSVKLWPSLHDTGKLTVTKNEEKSHTIEITGFDFITLQYEKLFVEYRCGLLELTGAKNPAGTSIKVGDKYIMRFMWD